MSEILFLVSFSSTKIGEISDMTKCPENFVSLTLRFVIRFCAAELRLPTNMTKAEEYKKNFKKDYNEAVKQYNEGKFQPAQRNLRPGIEKFCKLIMYSLTTDEKEVCDLIGGTKYLDYKDHSVKESRNEISKEGTSLIDLAKNYIFYSRPQLLEPDKNMKRAKSLVDTDFETLKGFYGTLSELAQHDEATSSLDIDTQSLGIFNYMPKLFDDLKKCCQMTFWSF